MRSLSKLGVEMACILSLHVRRAHIIRKSQAHLSSIIDERRQSVVNVNYKYERNRILVWGDRRASG